MSLTLTFSDRRFPSVGKLADATELSQVTAQYGQGVLPSLDVSLTSGTGSGKANDWHLGQRTLAATTFDLIDLAGGLTNYRGTALTFTKIKRILVALTSPDGTAKLRVGPQNQSNPWAGPWGGSGATVYQDVLHSLDLWHPYAGWTVTAGSADIFPVYNPGGSSVTYSLWVIGEV